MRLTIRTREGRHEIECPEDERILYAGLRSGLPLPFECATGTCGTCKARARSLEHVHELWSDAPGQSYLKPERAEFLMCQSVPTRDCELLVPGRTGPALPHEPCWRAGHIAEVRDLTHDVRYFEVALDAALDYEAGQFVVVESQDVPGFRAYSMVNFEPGGERLAFVIKKKPDGAFSEWLFENSVEGARLKVFGPLGRATFDPGEAKDVLCIAGGSGIAGMMAILEKARSKDYFRSHRGHVFFGVRTMDDAFFLDEIADHKSAAGDALDVTIALSEEDPPAAETTDHPALGYDTGFVHEVATRHMNGHFEQVVAFVAGPPPMVDGALRMLVVEGRVPASDIRYDKFS